MDELHTKACNQAWRRKPRRFAPKSRLGCKTCKIRRVKCDLSQPSCLKCRSTGRTCDGYGATPPASETNVEPGHYHQEKGANRAKSCDGHPLCSTISGDQPKQWHVKDLHRIPQELGPFMILPVTGSAQIEAMSFFELFSVKHLNEYHPCESWRNALMFFSQTVPSVRNAAIALALIHRNHLHSETIDHEYQSQSLRGRLTDTTPLLHYNRAIQLLLNQEGGDSTEKTAITLLVCYLFTCFDHLAGNDVQAFTHLRGGVELSRSFEKTALGSDSAYDDANPSGARRLISQVTRQLRRLDMQAVTFLLEWNPVDVQDTVVSHLPPFDGAFSSLDQAADHLHLLVARIMRLRNMEQQISPMDDQSLSPSSVKPILHGHLDTWSRLFENTLQENSYYETNSLTYPLISLLRLQHKIMYILLRTSGPGREMDYDNFLPQFQQCVTLAADVAAAHVRYSGSLLPTFTPEIGILPVLYMTGVKCRDPVLRREVVRILRRQPIREAVWDSISTAKVVERVIEIEEGGSGEGIMTQGMEQIAVWQRVETMSWIRDGGQSAPRMDLSYTLGGRNHLHLELTIQSYVLLHIVPPMQVHDDSHA